MKTINLFITTANYKPLRAWVCFQFLKSGGSFPIDLFMCKYNRRTWYRFEDRKPNLILI